MRLINQQGEQIGVLRTDCALVMAEKADLDLVEISPAAQPPVCRIMNFGKYQFEQSKRKAAQKKRQRLIHLKEVKFRPSTDVGDYQVKLRKITTFVDRGDKVKVSLRFRGREMQHRELGLALLNRVKNDLENIIVEQEPKLEGRQMTIVIAKAKGENNKTKRENHAEIKD